MILLCLYTWIVGKPARNLPVYWLTYMPTKRITTRSIQAAAKPSFLWDDKLKGFGCRIAADGRVSWLVQKKIGGREGKATRVVIGHSPPMELAEARTAAEIAIGEVARGIDLPTKKRLLREAKCEALNAPTLCEAAELFLRRRKDEYVKRKRKAAGRYWSELEMRFTNEIIPALGQTTQIPEITKTALRKLIEAKQDAQQHGGARLLFAALRPFFTWCVEQELIERSPLDGISPPKPLESRDRVLTSDEIKAFWTATATERLFGPFYRLLLLTAQRREEVGAMQWSEIDLDASTWTIPKARTKNGKAHLVHLSPQAVSILQTLPQSDGFIFSTTAETPISGYAKAKARLDLRMQNVPHWRVHDLRRTAATGMQSLGVQPQVVEKVLNHSLEGILKVYQQHDYLPERKAALHNWGLLVMRTVGNFSAENVITLQRLETRTQLSPSATSLHGSEAGRKT